jgi:hypothetical protein
MIRLRAIFIVSLGTALAGCARSVQTPPVTPADIPSLESARQQRPNDASVLTRLGIAYYDAKEYGNARDVLRSVLALENKPFTAAVYLGLSNE